MRTNLLGRTAVLKRETVEIVAVTEIDKDVGPEDSHFVLLVLTKEGKLKEVGIYDVIV